jgi:uncharacterized damage-inducible protein DinB
VTTDSRVDPDLRASEHDTLKQFLDYHRDTLRMKTEGLTSEQLNATVAPSTMTLGGMLKHLALVEDHWFSVILHGRDDAAPWQGVDWDADRDWDWHSAADDTPEQLRALLDDAIAASDRCLAEAVADGGLDRLSVRESSRGEGHFSVRWILVHMVEEYARHNGHADLLRESIDGQTGE